MLLRLLLVAGAALTAHADDADLEENPDVAMRSRV